MTSPSMQKANLADWTSPDGSVRLLHGDVLERMAELPDASVDAVVTDPPYGIGFMGREWDSDFIAQGIARKARKGTQIPPGHGRLQASGYIEYDRSLSGNQAFQQWSEAWATAALRVLKPGGHLVAFGGTRTHHRLWCALEDAGFEIRDTLCWLYGSGFPKSLDVSKAIDRQRDDYEPRCRVAEWLRPNIERIGFDVVTRAFGFKDETMARARWTTRSQPQTPTCEQWEQLRGLCGFNDEMDAEVWRLNGRKGQPGDAWAEREVVGVKSYAGPAGNDANFGVGELGSNPTKRLETASATDAARQWDGWGTALKPAWEIVTLARKPYAVEGERGIIAESLTRLEAQLWSLLPAKAAEESFGLSPSAYAEACGFAQWTAAERSNTRADLCGQMDTSRFVSALTSCLNTVLSWSNTLAALSNPPNTSTTEAETGQTIDWRTLSSCVSGLTPHTIIEAEMKAPGSRCAVLPAARYLNAVVVRQNATLELSALAPAISNGQARCQAEAAQGFSPAWEPIVLARKPLVGTVAANVLTHGTGALNVDGCRVGTVKDWPTSESQFKGWRKHGPSLPTPPRGAGRWPANVVLDEEAAAMLDAQSGERPGASSNSHRTGGIQNCYGQYGETDIFPGHGDSGGASRFFYCAKASRAERGNGNNHPTVKPLALMRWLVRLVTPPGGLILDPFVGSGTTALAAVAEGFRCVGIDNDEEYLKALAKRSTQIVMPLEAAP